MADVVLAVLLLALVLFAPLARSAADRLPRPPESRDVLALAGEGEKGGVSRPVQDLPAGLATDSSVARLADVWPLAVPALGQSGAAELLTILGQSDFEDRLSESAIRDREGVTYPYRYPAMTRILDAAPEGGRTREATALGAALITLSTRIGAETIANAPAAAYAVLDRAREADDCAAQLDLLLLVTADAQPRDDVVATETERAEALCTGDPTPAWMHAQYLSQRATAVHGGIGEPTPLDAQKRADDLFDGLLAEFPQAVGVLAGWADNRLRVAERTASAQPFTARLAFEQAAAGYRRADTLSGGDDHLPGRARALLGLGEPATAAELMADAADVAFPGVHLQVLLHAQEDGHEFAAASATARRLHAAGTAAFTQDGPAYPIPGNADFEGRGPIGTGRYTLLITIDLQPSPEGGGNGALVLDSSYVPAFREERGFTGAAVGCPDWAWRRDAVLAGAARTALTDLPSGVFTWFDGIRPDDYCPINVTFADLVRAEAGQPPQDLEIQEADSLWDSRQNLWRWAGDLDHADQVIGEWAASAGADDPRPVQRLAEVRFLQRNYDEAATLFGQAARLYRDRQWNDDLVVSETLLQRGGALLRAGRADEARPLLRTLDQEAARGAAYQRSLENEDPSARFALVAYHARALLGDSQRDSGALHAAVEDYEAARELVPKLLEAEVTGFRPARVDNNLAVALAALDRGDDALKSAERAVVADPKSPVFLLTAGVAADRAGDTGRAIEYYRKTLASDPGTFPAANDLGVQLASQDRVADASQALRSAVSAAPGYALGWFNLGVVQAKRGPAHLLSAQGALARAYELDPTLTGREPTPTPDETRYRTRLDLSRPLPPRWSFARLQQVSPATSASMLAVLLLGVGLVRSTGRGRGYDLASQFLEPVSQWLGRIRLLGRLRRPLWAVLVTVVVFTIPALRDPALGATPIFVGALGVLVVALAGLRMRALRARRLDVPAVQESWVPGMTFGLVAGSFGAPWAPLPVVRTPPTTPSVSKPDAAEQASRPSPAERNTARVHAAAPITLGALAVVLFVEAAWLGVPLTRAWAVAALIMTASTLLPLEPLDGARLSKGGVIGSVGVLAGAMLVILGVV